MNLLLFVYRRIILFFYLLRKHFFRIFFASLGLWVALFVLISILGIIRPAKKYLVEKLERSLPPDMIVVKAPQNARPTGLIQQLLNKEKNIKLGVSSKKIKSMYNWSEVSSIFRTQILQKSLLASFDHALLKKLGIHFDLMIQGISEDFVKKDVVCKRKFASRMINHNGERIEIIPLLIPETFAEIVYAYSLINNLPPIQKKDMIGLRLFIRVGESITRIRQDNTKRSYILGEICGFLPQGIVSVAGAPMKWVRSKHLNSGQKTAANVYDKVFLKIKNPKNRVGVLRKIKKLGLLTGKTGQAQYGRLFEWLDKFDIAVWVAVSLLIFIGAISLSNSFMLLAIEKKYEFGLYLVFGSSPLFLWVLMFLEGAAWGFFHSILALIAAESFSQQIQAALMSFFTSSSVKDNLMPILEFSITNTERFTIILGSVFLAGMSSLIPTLFLTFRKTLRLVKKD